MAKRPSKQGLSTGILIVLLAGVLVSSALQAGATHQPADKVAAAGSKAAVIGNQQNVTLLTGTMKTAKPTDLMIHVTAECSILTKLSTLGGPPPATGSRPDETDRASGTIRVWIEIETDGVTRVVPIQSASEPPQDGSDPNSGDEATDSATFCNRVYERTVSDQENDNDGFDGETDYIQTKSANAFNWLLFNAGSGLHTIRVMADLEFESTPPLAPGQTCQENTSVEQTCANGLVGNRTLIVEPTKMSNDASTVTGTS